MTKNLLVKIGWLIISLIIILIMAKFYPSDNQFTLAKQNGYLLLAAKSNNPTAEAITGWTIANAAGAKITLPPATRLFQSGAINFEEAVFLKPGEQAIITFDSSPVGVSFLVNRCSLYLGQFQTFVPPLGVTVSDRESPGINFYNTCVNEKRSANDFYRGEWRLYAGQSSLLDQPHGLLKLRDARGYLRTLVRY